MNTTQLLIGLSLLLIGALIVRGCIREFRENFASAAFGDLMDYFSGHTLAVVAGLLLTGLGAAIVLKAFSPGASMQFLPSFPFVKFVTR